MKASTSLPTTFSASAPAPARATPPRPAAAASEAATDSTFMVDSSEACTSMSPLTALMPSSAPVMNASILLSVPLVAIATPSERETPTMPKPPAMEAAPAFAVMVDLSTASMSTAPTVMPVPSPVMEASTLALIRFCVLTPAPLMPPPTCPTPTATEPARTVDSTVWFDVAVTLSVPCASMELSTTRALTLVAAESRLVWRHRSVLRRSFSPTVWPALSSRCAAVPSAARPTNS